MWDVQSTSLRIPIEEIDTQSQVCPLRKSSPPLLLLWATFSSCGDWFSGLWIAPHKYCRKKKKKQKNKTQLHKVADPEHTWMVLEVLLLVSSRAEKGTDFGVFPQCCSHRTVPFSLSLVSCHLFCFPRKEDVSYMKKSNHVQNHVGGSPEEAEVLIRDKKHNRKPSFLRALLRTFGPYFLIGSFFKLIQDLLSFVNPQLLRSVTLWVVSVWDPYGHLALAQGICLWNEELVSLIVPHVYAPSPSPCNAVRLEFFVVDSAVNWTNFTEMLHL